MPWSERTSGINFNFRTMKKISLKNLDALGIQKLSRETLKNVKGGNGCPDGEFQCTNGTCIPMSYVRDGMNDCPDGSDEVYAFCNCRLYTSAGVESELDGDATSEGTCSASCKKACEDANASGGDCTRADAVFTHG